MSRILFVSQDFPPAVGGIQTYARCLAEALGASAAAVEVLAPAQSGDAEVDAELSVPVRRTRTTSDLMRLTVLPRLLAHARSMRADTVLTSNWYTAAPALVARRLGVVERVFVAVHGQEVLKDLLPGPLAPAYRLHRRHVLRAVDGCFPVSGYTGRLLESEGVDPARIHVVPNGTDVAYWQALGRTAEPRAFRERYGLGDGPILGTVARLVPRKGVDTVIQALPTISAAYPAVRYVVAGDGPARPALEALAASAGVADRVTFLGRAPWEAVAALHATQTVFVMPNRAEGPSVEGFGLVFREANALGRPVIGGDSGGVPDAIRDGETGLLVPPGDPTALADAVVRMLDDPAWSDRLGANGRALVEAEGTWAHAAARMLQVMAGSAATAPR
jgi:phosphatidylinositol alpha-1,6-mannosyltransferase